MLYYIIGINHEIIFNVLVMLTLQLNKIVFINHFKYDLILNHYS